jgi:hypothetical protein
MKSMALLLGVLALAMFTGCGEQADEATTDTPQDTEEAGTADITITNGLEAWDIISILIDPSDEAWGEERLGAGELLLAGESFKVEVEQGTWDMMVIDEDGDSYTLWQVEVGPDGYEWNVTLDDLDAGWGEDVDLEPKVVETGEGSAFVSIVNDLQGWDIYFAYVDPTDAPWGEDRLGMDLLYQDDQLIVWVDPGVYDIRVEDQDGDTYTLWGVEVDEAGFEWYVTLDDLDMMSDEEMVVGTTMDVGNGSAPVSIINDLGGWDIYYVYVDPSDGPWGDDRLGADILTGSSEIVVWVDPGTYDMKVEDVDGDTYTLWGVEVDENGYTWSVTLSDMD